MLYGGIIMIICKVEVVNFKNYNILKMFIFYLRVWKFCDIKGWLMIFIRGIFVCML